MLIAALALLYISAAGSAWAEHEPCHTYDTVVERQLQGNLSDAQVASCIQAAGFEGESINNEYLRLYNVYLEKNERIRWGAKYNSPNVTPEERVEHLRLTIIQPPSYVDRIVEKKVFVDRPIERKVLVDRPIYVTRSILVPTLTPPDSVTQHCQARSIVCNSSIFTDYGTALQQQSSLAAYDVTAVIETVDLYVGLGGGQAYAVIPRAITMTERQ